MAASSESIHPFDAITPEQRTLLAEMRAHITQTENIERYDDHFLWRFLSAREYNLEAAEKMFRNHLEWRRRMSADTVLREFKPSKVMEEYFALGWWGHDKEGNPIRYERPGQVDSRGLLRSACRSEILKFRTAFMMEDALRRCAEASARTGKRIDRITFIVDFEGFTLRSIYRPYLQLTREVFKTLEENYPQVLRRVFIVNPPGIFPYVFALVSRLMHENTRKKFVMCASNFQESLLSEIAPEELPAMYGGTGPNPGQGPDAPKFGGGVIPQELYLSENLNKEGHTTHELRAGQSVDVIVDISLPNQILNWDFFTEANDIAFSVLLDEGGTMKTIVPATRVECDQVPESGCVHCEKAGRYVVRFDNSFSFFRAKTVHAAVGVLSEGAAEATPDVLVAGAAAAQVVSV